MGGAEGDSAVGGAEEEDLAAQVGAHQQNLKEELATQERRWSGSHIPLSHDRSP
jgi:hypothetical protein